MRKNLYDIVSDVSKDETIDDAVESMGILYNLSRIALERRHKIEFKILRTFVDNDSIHLLKIDWQAFNKYKQLKANTK